MNVQARISDWTGWYVSMHPLLPCRQASPTEVMRGLNEQVAGSA